MIEKQLKNAFKYDPKTGSLIWAIKPSIRVEVGREVDTQNPKGYLVVKFLGKTYLVHRLVWFLHYGTYPKGQIDHINGCRHDNRIDNLREVTQEGNSKNKKLYSKNKTGIAGVYKMKEGCYRAVIRNHGVLKHLGYFKSLEEAAKARSEAEACYNFHDNHGKR